MNREDILSPSAPIRTTWLGRKLGGGLLKLLGWKIVGKLPDEKKLIIIAAPHTSNWDYIVAMAALQYMGVRVRYMMKSEMMVWPFSLFFIWLGGVPVYRKQKTDIIEQMAQWFGSNDNVWLGLAPEGTRSKTKKWKTGFLRIAQAADVPIFMAGLDGAKKQIILDKIVSPSGSYREQAAAVKEYVDANFVGVNPKKQ